MPSSLPHPPAFNYPDPPFTFDTYVVHDVKISNNLAWSNPLTKSEGARPILLYKLMSLSACFIV